jgi:signal transduction histidine kinase
MADTILLVDDEEGIRKVLGISLADAGYNVLTAGSGEDALSTFRECRPPVVLTDIKMPGMDGIELLKAIKRESPDTEVIMITGHGDMNLAVRSLQLDAADFVTKPIDDTLLDIALKRALDRMTMRRKIREYTEDFERMVEEKTRRLLEAERLAAIGQTVATLAHAIKNVIGGLRGGMFVLEKGMELKNEKYRFQGWEMVKGSVDKISNLALDLLDYAREREPDYIRTDPNAPLGAVYDLMLPRSVECGVALKIEPAEDLGEVSLDSEAIHCCLLNLVVNALDACLDVNCVNKEKEIVLRSRRRDGWAVEYQVEDNGCGMDDETRAKVFRTFFSTKGVNGTGLGLMIARKIITEHEGSIEVESEPGKGTLFLVRLPEGRDGRRCC